MHIATLSDPVALSRAVAHWHKVHRFLCAIRHPVTQKLHLYASDASAYDALLEARTDLPKGVVEGEYEYLSRETLARMKPDDPIRAALRNL